MPADAVVVADVAKGQTPELDAAMQGAQALIIASSAVPQVSFIPSVGVQVHRVRQWFHTRCHLVIPEETTAVQLNRNSLYSDLAVLRLCLITVVCNR